MNVLLHVCCAPCLIYPAQFLAKRETEFTGYFFNPNIHPYREFKRRLDAVVDYTDNIGIPMIIDRNYGLQDFLRQVVFKERDRCRFCYRSRLQKTVSLAVEREFSGFSSTLLYSRYQNHEAIVNLAEEIASRSTLSFFYHDFRQGWQIGIDESKQRTMYRQSYCGCIYSEQERYDNRLKKQLKKGKKPHV